MPKDNSQFSLVSLIKGTTLSEVGREASSGPYPAELSNLFTGGHRNDTNYYWVAGYVVRHMHLWWLD
jgi:hypothetical protein